MVTRYNDAEIVSELIYVFEKASELSQLKMAEHPDQNPAMVITVMFGDALMQSEIIRNEIVLRTAEKNGQDTSLYEAIIELVQKMASAQLMQDLTKDQD